MPKRKLPEKILHNPRIDQLYQKISQYIHTARQNVAKTIDVEMVKAYWLCGKGIIEEEQQGFERAQYGTFLIKELSLRLTKEHGQGFSTTTLKDMRAFYLEYQSVIEKGRTVCDLFHPKLSWSHYRVLMRIDRMSARNFYEKESIQNNWSVREMVRQVNSFLFDRLTRSKNKQQILNLAYKGQEINTPEDAMKDPIILEFLGLPESHRQIESKIEEALINNLQHFLLELGKGFAFVGRQKRLTLDGQHFYADLVFYHTILKCYAIIDIKTHELTHADLGQMLLYVNYFDKKIKLENDNPTIGLVLCTENRDTMAKYMLGEKAKQIFASKYQFHLPTEEQLEKELKRELKELECQSILNDKKNNL